MWSRLKRTVKPTTHARMDPTSLPEPPAATIAAWDGLELTVEDGAGTAHDLGMFPLRTRADWEALVAILNGADADEVRAEYLSYTGEHPVVKPPKEE